MTLHYISKFLVPILNNFFATVCVPYAAYGICFVLQILIHASSQELTLNHYMQSDGAEHHLPRFYDTQFFIEIFLGHFSCMLHFASLYDSII